MDKKFETLIDDASKLINNTESEFEKNMGKKQGEADQPMTEA